MEKIRMLQKMIDESSNIVFFGGAGVSTDSGIKDFKGVDGLYKEQFDKSPEYMLSINCFLDEPDNFYNFYKGKLNSLFAEPNITHKYLKELEELGKLKAIVTQNIDGLHQKAGSKNVYEIHGTVYENYCMKCQKNYDAEYVFNSLDVPRCECGSIIKPNVVLYGEMLPESYLNAQRQIYEADLLIVAGTSLTVEPASSLVRMFNGKYLVIVNNDQTPYDSFASLVINDKLKNVFGKLTH